jgi:hypothetical protein
MVELCLHFSIFLHGVVHSKLIKHRNEFNFTFTWRYMPEDGTLQLPLQIRIILEKFTSRLWRPEVQCRVHSRPPLDSILNHISPLHTVTPSFLSFIIIFSCHLRLGRPSGLLHLVVRPKPDKKFSSLSWVLKSPSIQSSLI